MSEGHYCLRCFLPVAAGQTYHDACLKSVFGRKQAPQLADEESMLKEQALLILKEKISIPGVQPKLSASLTKDFRVTLLQGLGGGYIIKPQHQAFKHLPEVEALCMQMARTCLIPTAESCLLRSRSGSLVYIVRRFDRLADKKIHQEDFCMLQERVTEDKYKSSLEQVAATLLGYSARPGLDAYHLYSLLLFCYLTGNGDMHLKNFSLQYLPGEGARLSPAYDLVASYLYGDDEESALTLNGRRNKLRRQDFEALLPRLHMPIKAGQNALKQLLAKLPKLLALVEQSYLPTPMQERLMNLMQARALTLQTP